MDYGDGNDINSLASVDNLTKELKALKYNAPLMELDVVFEHVYKLLTDKGKEAMDSPAVQGLTCVKDGNVEWVVRCFGVTTNLKSVGVMKIAEIINEITTKHKVVGVLCKSAQMNLYRGDTSFPVVTFAFLAFKPNDAILLEKHRYSFLEGSLPNEYLETLDDIERAKKLGLVDGLDL
jgi:hypothetical protein